MLVIIKNAIRERIRRRELYIIVGIGILMLLLCGSDSSSISIDGKAVTGYENMFMVLHTLVNALSCVLAVVLSLRTIPNEYERRNSHLVWVRGISQPVYHGGLAIANVVSTFMAAWILYGVLAVYMLINGHGAEAIKLFPGSLGLAINISVVSIFTSVLSIGIPVMAAGVIAILFAGIGVFHSLLDVMANVLGGVGGKCLSVLLTIVPDMHGIQKQSQLFVMGDKTDAHVLFVGLLAIYIISIGFFVLKRKEA